MTYFELFFPDKTALQVETHLEIPSVGDTITAAGDKEGDKNMVWKVVERTYVINRKYSILSKIRLTVILVV